MKKGELDYVLEEDSYHHVLFFMFRNDDDVASFDSFVETIFASGFQKLAQPTKKISWIHSCCWFFRKEFIRTKIVSFSKFMAKKDLIPTDMDMILAMGKQIHDGLVI